MKKIPTLILGASPNPFRYAYQAVRLLADNGHPVFPFGIKEGDIEGIAIYTDTQQILVEDIHTVSIYLSPYKQVSYRDWMLELKPQRVIFNPGAENRTWANELASQGIEVHNACTLVMLRTGMYEAQKVQNG